MGEQQTGTDGPPRCPVKGCPVIYRGGPDRLCPIHQQDSDTGTIAALMGSDRRSAAVNVSELQTRR